MQRQLVQTDRLTGFLLDILDTFLWSFAEIKTSFRSEFVKYVFLLSVMVKYVWNTVVFYQRIKVSPICLQVLLYILFSFLL